MTYVMTAAVALRLFLLTHTDASNRHDGGSFAQYGGCASAEHW
jgi:drug/metabolite transporter superfamily protein YnfA